MASVISATITQLAYYALLGYLIYSVKSVVLEWLKIRATILDFFFPRTPEEISIDDLRMGKTKIVKDVTPQIPEMAEDDRIGIDPPPDGVITLH